LTDSGHAILDQSRRGVGESIHTYSSAGTLSRNHLQSPKKRKKLLSELSHFKDLNPKFMVAIPAGQQNPLALAKLLKAKGAGERCYVMSENSRLDGREVDLDTALKETVGYQMGTFISCVPGRLGYFEDEDGRCILERR
jgi:hypothetical protein